jgi:hypothetical protein
MIERGSGATRKNVLYHDLDHLAGSWSSAEEKKFHDDTKFFDQIDSDIYITQVDD